MKDGHIRLDGSHTVLLPRIRKTMTATERMKGLLGTRFLKEGEGLLIIPCNSIHTFFMRFPIDVVFLDKKSVILNIQQFVHPFRMVACWQANAVLELMAGQVKKSGLHKGHRLIWE